MSSLLVEHSFLGPTGRIEPRQRFGSVSNRTSRAGVRFGGTHATQHSTAATKDFLVLRVLSFLTKVLMVGVVLSVAGQYFHFCSMVGQLSRTSLLPGKSQGAFGKFRI